MRAWVKAALLALLPVVFGVAGACAILVGFLLATKSLGQAICLTAVTVFGIDILFSMLVVAVLIAVNLRDIHDEIVDRWR